MSQVLVTESYLSNIASAIRLKNGASSAYTPSQMASAIGSIVSAGDLSIISKIFSSNGSYSPASDNADAFAGVVVDVPNSYAAGDEGKVVMSGALVAQTSITASLNSTYDTTGNNQVVVSVSNTYSQADEGKVVASGALSAQMSSTISQNGTYDTTMISQLTASIEGGGSGGSGGALVTPAFQGNTAIYVARDGSTIYRTTSVNQYMNIFSVVSGHKYALFVGETVGTRRRAGFFSGKTLSDFSSYLSNPVSNEKILYSDGVWLAPFVSGTDDNGNSLTGRIICTPSYDGVITYGTDNTGVACSAYCVDLDATGMDVPSASN